jgi:short-subunit dehydrogenase
MHILAIGRRNDMTIKLKPLNEQVIVITGASSGIGLATAEAAAEAGAKLVLAARSGETLADIVDRLGAAGGDVVHVTADVADTDAALEIAQAAVTRFGGIDTWINNAGVSIYGRLDEVSEVDARRLFDVDFWGVVHGSLAALGYMRRRGGTIINVGSEVSDAVVPMQGYYSAAKHAVKGFTDALRVEVQEVDGAPVAITLIQPTAVDTPFPQHGKNYMDKEPKLPSPMIEPEKVAAAILKAATDPTTEVKVGAMAKLDAAIAKLSPTLAKKLEGMQAGRQQYDEPPRDPEGTLDKPGESGQKRGSGPARNGARP